ncbi:DUF6037 family protein [Enterococcus mundtii]|uniref:DUF6037 family protein n=1 Tax=Enterococcus mundtii TaxID=53346 RepID=UPI00232D01D4|nr:DUF6037 family protein [Enterococcus mundtii]EMF0110316.1 hypothetical protein [Enterococcus hirae]MDB7087216.1 DUF6037 family protein [Enterococcus mundtii]
MTYTFKTIKNELLSREQTVGIFDFSYNNKKYTLLFTYINKQDQAEIFFTKVGTQSTLSLPISQKFSINTFFDKQTYKNLRLFFEVPYVLDGPPFRPIELFQTIDSGLKFKSIDKTTSREERSSLYRVPNPHAIYYNYMIDWDLHKGDKHYSQFNRQKVQVLIPELYERIRNRNISVFFQDEPLNSKAETNAIQLDLDQFDLN